MLVQEKKVNDLLSKSPLCTCIWLHNETASKQSFPLSLNFEITSQRVLESKSCIANMNTFSLIAHNFKFVPTASELISWRTCAGVSTLKERERVIMSRDYEKVDTYSIVLIHCP